MFKFLYRPEYIKPGTKILMREGRTKGFGIITRVFPKGADQEVVGSGP